MKVCGASGAWTSVEIERRLNAGETIAWDVPHFEVSLPLSPQMWLQVVYGNASGPAATERAADLVGRLVTDPRAARFYTGLAALDDPTPGVAGGTPARAVAPRRRTPDRVRPVRRRPARARRRGAGARRRHHRCLPRSSGRRLRRRARTVRGPVVRLGTDRGRLRPHVAPAGALPALCDRRGGTRPPRLAPRPEPARPRHRDVAAARPPIRRTPRRTRPGPRVHAEAGPQVRRPSEREHCPAPRVRLRAAPRAVRRRRGPAGAARGWPPSPCCRRPRRPARRRGRSCAIPCSCCRPSAWASTT